MGHNEIMTIKTPAQHVISIIGGVRATARKLKKTPGTISTWKKKGNVPGPAQAQILAIAEEENLDITAHDLILGRKQDA